MRSRPLGGLAHREQHRRSPGLRALVLVSALVLAIVGIPGVAGAGAPFSGMFQGTEVSCESGPQFLGFFIGEEETGTFINVFFDEEGVITLGGVSEEISFDGVTLVAEVELYEDFFENPFPEFVGVATFEATFEPIGDPETDFDRFRDGNVWVELATTFQLLSATGTAVLDGYFNFDLADCSASQFTEEFWQTNPNAFNGRFEGRFLDCALESSDGFGFLFADASPDSFLEMFVLAGDGSGLFGFGVGFEFTDTALNAVVELFDEETGDGPYEAFVEATLTPTGNISASELLFQNARVKIMAEELEVTGTVTVGDDVFEMVDCLAESFAERVHFANPNGPKPTGKTPVNDTPAGAVLLPGHALNAQTSGAANAPEVGCAFIFGEDEVFDLPIGKTLWYSFEGTGGEVTVDSAGSNFDTIMGVYDAALNQLTCVDDVPSGTGFSLQAAATIDTEEGATYYVQIGGFGFFEEELGEFGRIRLDMN